MRAFFDAAVATGAEVLHEPRVWPEYHPNYYGAFVRDPDGNNVEAVCHAPAWTVARLDLRVDELRAQRVAVGLAGRQRRQRVDHDHPLRAS